MNQTESAYARTLFGELFDELSTIGLDSAGATTRLAWTEEAAAAAEWFDSTARRLGLNPETDRNGNRWAWAGAPGPGAIVTGSHLDSVRHGGRFDGALGVVTGLIAVHLLMRRGDLPAPMAVVSFADEEGGRFDTPTFGSRAMLGTLDVQAILERRDREGITLREALRGAGLEPERVGPDPERLAQIGAFVEVHIEQDTLLTRAHRPIALGTEILPHGRWRIDLHGEANHAGTTPLAIRRDPMLAAAGAVTAARRAAGDIGALATIGKLEVSPNATNAIAERVSFVAAVRFAPQLRDRVAAVLAEHGIEDVPMATGAGHDSGALANAVPTAMLFVRSATGASHSPRELASLEDCESGIGALTEVLAALAGKQRHA